MGPGIGLFLPWENGSHWDCDLLNYCELGKKSRNGNGQSSLSMSSQRFTSSRNLVHFLCDSP